MEFYTGLIEFNWTLLINMCTMIVLFLILKNKFFEKIRNHMIKRQEAVANSIANAEQKNLEADQLKADYQKKLADVDEEARERIRLAAVKAESQAKDIIAEAQRKSVELLKKTEQEIEREKIKAIGELKDQIAELAMYAAEKVIEKELDARAHHAMIGRIIEEAGAVKWQN